MQALDLPDEIGWTSDDSQASKEASSPESDEAYFIRVAREFEDAKSTPYKYTPLEDAGKQIRLLRFCDTEHDDLIICIMETVWVPDQPKYSAISYTWGSSEKTRYIRLNGRHIEVTENAFYALTQVLELARPYYEYLWIDSICINQTDLAEKSAQVQMMGDIFESAAIVFACVGPHKSDSEKLFHALEALYEFSQSDDYKRYPDGHTVQTRTWSWFQEYLEQHWPAPKLVYYGHPFASSFERFGNRDYWQRLWIVQETWLAKDLRIFCGSSAISITRFALFWKYRPTDKMLEESGWSSTSWIWCQMWYTISQSRHLPEKGADKTHRHQSTTDDLKLSPVRSEASATSINIVDALSRYANYQCADFRDRVYALSRIAEWPGDK